MTTPASSDIYTTTSKQILVTRDPVYVHPAVIDGHYIGRKPHSYLPFAIFATVFNPVMGPLAIIFAIMSTKAYRAGDLRYATKWSQYAFLTGCITFVLSIIVYIVIIFSLETCTIRTYGVNKTVEECTSGISGGHSY